MTTKIKIVIAFLVVYVVWGSTYLGMRVAIESMPPFLMASVRCLIAGLFLYIWARCRGAARPANKKWLPAMIIGFLLLVCGNGGIVFASKTVPSGMVSLLVASAPIFFVLLEWLRPKGTAPGMRVIAGLVIGVIGMLLLIGPASLSSEEGLDMLGVFCIFFSALCWSAGSLYSRSQVVHESALVSTGMQMLTGGIMLLIVSRLAGESFDPSTMTMRSTVALSYLIVFGSIFAFSAYTWLLKTVKPTQLSTYAYVNPVVAVFLGWALASEPVTPITIIAAAVILVAVWVITGAEKKSSSVIAENIPDHASESDLAESKLIESK